jgi:hypothetical protein
MKTYKQPQDISMNSQTSYDHDTGYDESDTSKTDYNSSLAYTPPSSPEKLGVPSRKRSYSLHQDPSSVSPMKKTRTGITSSIRAGLEKTEVAIGKPGEAPGLFQYFKKATDEEKKEYLTRMDEEIKTRLERERFYSQKAKLEQETITRNRNRERKRLQRARMKNLEIMSGLRSPKGTKHQVRLIIQHPVHY